jgi:hypothetical protein
MRQDDVLDARQAEGHAAISFLGKKMRHMHFNHDMLHIIFSFMESAKSTGILLNVCLVCKEWNRVASKFYWRHVGFGTEDVELTRIERLIAHPRLLPWKRVCHQEPLAVYVQGGEGLR